MAPIKFEDHIKGQLEKRELKPSAGSWEKLNAQLDNESSAGSGRKWWLGAVAAVFIVIVTTTFLLKQENNFTPQIVETPQKEEIKVPVKKSQFQAPVEVATQEPKEREVPEKSKNQILTPTPLTSEKTDLAVADVSPERVMPERSESPQLNSVLQDNSEHSRLISNKLREIVAAVKRKERNQETLSTTEVEALLAQAAVEISKNNLEYSSGYIDPKALLADVEQEMYQSFKEKVFEVLKDGYQKAMIAVSNRTEPSQDY